MVILVACPIIIRLINPYDDDDFRYLPMECFMQLNKLSHPNQAYMIALPRYWV